LAPLVALEMALGARWSVPEAAIRHLLLTQLPGYLGHFAAGMAIALVWLRRRDRVVGDRTSLGWLALLVAAIALVAWTYSFGGSAYLGDAGSWIVTLASFALAMLALTCGGPWPVRLVAT